MSTLTGLFDLFTDNASLTELMVERLTAVLSVSEGLLWLILPACLQWSILFWNPRSKLRWLLLAPLFPIIVIFALFVLILGGLYLIASLFAGELLVLDFLETMACLGSGLLTRGGLLLLGWGLGWQLYRFATLKGGRA